MQLLEVSSREVVTISSIDSIDKAIALMEEHGIHHLPVMAGRTPIGIVSDRDILLAVGWTTSAERQTGRRDLAYVVGPRRVEQIMSHPVATISPDDTITHAIRRMIDLHIGALPVVGGGELLGLVTESDLISRLPGWAVWLPAARDLCDTPVSAVMHTRIGAVSPQARLDEIMTVFSSRHARHVPVVVDDRLLGIISDRDVRRSFGLSALRDMQAQDQGRYFDDTRTAADIMTVNVSTVEPTQRIGEVAKTMLDRRVHCIPVTDGDVLKGLVTHTDLVREIVRREIV
ncbi:MAG: CBS domain-containing protein [Planctomycetes bacterium]|nr:CBS domain-containing protein [Planctomycetota bacterium]